MLISMKREKSSMASVSMNSSSVASEAQMASTAEVKRVNSHHFCRAPSSRRMTASAAGDM